MGRSMAPEFISVIVYNLACDRQHPFEGWFASPADFENQRDRGLVECPLCGSNAIERKLHAPRINMGAQQSAASVAQESRAAKDAKDAKDAKETSAVTVVPEAADAGSAGSVPTDIDLGKLREAIVSFADHVRESTEYVGEKFADEARAMHYGEKPHKGIRGRADKDTAQALRDEGITFQALPFPVDFPKAH